MHNKYIMFNKWENVTERILLTDFLTNQTLGVCHLERKFSKYHTVRIEVYLATTLFNPLHTKVSILYPLKWDMEIKNWSEIG